MLLFDHVLDMQMVTFMKGGGRMEIVMVMVGMRRGGRIKELYTLEVGRTTRGQDMALAKTKSSMCVCILCMICT